MDAEVGMTKMVRYYFQLNENLIDHYGGHQFFTASCEEPADGWMPRIAGSGPNSYYTLVSNSDYVILCDGDSVRFIKNRHEDPEFAKVDPDEFVLIKMKSVEIG
jgi:hypothetical protein